MELRDLLIKNVSKMFPVATFMLDFQSLVEGIKPGTFAAIVPVSHGVTINNIVNIVVARALLEGWIGEIVAALPRNPATAAEVEFIETQLKNQEAQHDYSKYAAALVDEPRHQAVVADRLKAIDTTVDTQASDVAPFVVADGLADSGRGQAPDGLRSRLSPKPRRRASRRPPQPGPVINSDDPQKDRWGGLAERDGLRVRVVIGDINADLFTFDAVVESVGGRPLDAPVIFHLHSTSYPVSVIHIRKIRSGSWATLQEVTATGVYTLGVQARTKNGAWVGLEFDLSTVPDLPRKFLGR